MGLVDAVSKYSGKANHLTFSMQALTGRTHVQQTHYNPQSHTFVRFVVGGGNKFSWRPGDGSIIDKNFREILSSMFIVSDKIDPTTGKRIKAKDLPTNERIALFEKQLASGALDNLIAMGQELQSVNQAFDSKGAKDLVRQFANLQDENQARALIAQSRQNFGADPLSADTKSMLAKHGDEALWYANGLIELARYNKAKKDGTPIVSNFSVEMDGKTHGPATNGAQLGVKEMAKRTGLIRNQDVRLTDEIDSREAMGQWMLNYAPSMAGTLYPQEHYDLYNEILALAVKDRANFLKKSPMTMGYGQELGSLKMHVETTVFSGDSSQEIQDILKSTNKVTPEEIVNFLHTMLVDSLFEVMDPKTVEISRLLRANNLLAVLTTTHFIWTMLWASGLMQLLSRCLTGMKQTTVFLRKASVKLVRLCSIVSGLKALPFGRMVMKARLFLADTVMVE